MNKEAGPESAFSNLPDFSIENELLSQGHKLIAGIDEAGRGALAGPLSIGLVLYDEQFIINPSENILKSVNDSKKLSPAKRRMACDFVEKESLYCFSMLVSHRTVDRLNINGATQYGIKKLLEILPVKPDVLLIDGNFLFQLDVPFISVIKGDSRSQSIASASVIAKVRRDEVVERLDSVYPGYDLKKNKGYGTLKHRNSIKERGFCPIHRRSYEPVKSMISEQKGMFD